MAPKVKDNDIKGKKEKKTLATKLKPEKLKNIPQFLRIKCPICFENINKDSASSTKCGHVFCTMCLKKALRRTPLCPTCRTRLKGPSGHHALYFDTNVCAEDREMKTVASVTVETDNLL